MEQSLAKKFLISVLRRFHLLEPAYRIHEARLALAARTSEDNRQAIMEGVGDGLPLPPPDLMVLVAGWGNVRHFLDSGQESARNIREALARQGLEIGNFKSILDFGCGCGRVMRCWEDLKGVKLHGSDYNAKLVEWCARNLNFASFSVNALDPPLPFQAGQFDFIYGLSVLTHLSEQGQFEWLAELKRVTMDSGYVLLTTQGNAFTEKLTAEERAEYDTGKFVIKYEEVSGTNLCGVFHPESYVRTHFSRYFQIVDFIPGGAKGNGAQDVVLLRKPPR